MCITNRCPLIFDFQRFYDKVNVCFIIISEALGQAFGLACFKKINLRAPEALILFTFPITQVKINNSNNIFLIFKGKFSFKAIRDRVMEITDAVKIIIKKKLRFKFAYFG